MRNGEYELIQAPLDYPGLKYRGRYAYEHHVIWWRATGTLPPVGYVIHHKNENTRDNRLENLELKTSPKHSSDHGKARRVPDESVTCAWCHRSFQLPARVLRFKRKIGQINFFCCKSHAVSLQQSLWTRETRHGTSSGYYNHRCRCDACRAYHAAKHRRYREKVRSGSL